MLLYKRLTKSMHFIILQVFNNGKDGNRKWFILSNLVVLMLTGSYKPSTSTRSALVNHESHLAADNLVLCYQLTLFHFGQAFSASLTQAASFFHKLPSPFPRFDSRTCPNYTVATMSCPVLNIRSLAGLFTAVILVSSRFTAKNEPNRRTRTVDVNSSRRYFHARIRSFRLVIFCACCTLTNVSHKEFMELTQK